MKEQIEQRIAELEESRQRWIQQAAIAQEQIVRHAGAIEELKRLIELADSEPQNGKAQIPDEVKHDGHR